MSDKEEIFDFDENDFNINLGDDEETPIEDDEELTSPDSEDYVEESGDEENEVELPGDDIEKSEISPQVEKNEIRHDPSKKLPQMDDLNSLIGNFQSKLETLRNEESRVSAMSSETGIRKNLFNSDPQETYKKIEESLETGLQILERAREFIEAAPDAEGFEAASYVMNSVQSMFKEFTAIWQKKLNYENNVNLEMLKLKNKKELDEHRMKLKLEYFNATTSKNITNSQEVVPFNTQNFIEAIVDDENKS